MKKVDFRKELKQLYKSSRKDIEVVDVPEMKFLMIDGKGDPATSREFQDAVETLFGVSYALKFMIKKGALEIDYGVMPLEGLWWADDMTTFDSGDKSQWRWTTMIMQPEYVTNDLFAEAYKQVEKRKNPPALSKIRFESFNEGQAAQTMHIGPFSEEGPTIKKVHDFIHKSGKRRSGKHHEIYLSDIRKAAPEKWETIIRQPMR